jgi:hypothetical protein
MIHIEQEPTSRQLTLCGRDIDIDLPGETVPLSVAQHERDWASAYFEDNFCVECAAKLDAAIRDYDPTPTDEEAWSGGIAENH